jgi:hypothetical protein
MHKHIQFGYDDYDDVDATFSRSATLAMNEMRFCIPFPLPVYIYEIYFFFLFILATNHTNAI